MKQTDALYTQLRSALIRRNDNEAIDILTTIVQIDPSDQDAARQLETLCASRKRGVNAGEQAPVSASTRDLYQKYRSACLAHDDDAAFAALAEIIRRDPADMNATQQYEELGKRMAARLAAELPAALEAQNAAHIARLVQQLKHYASEEYLQELPEYERAGAVFRTHQLKTAQRALADKFEALAYVDEPVERHKEAADIERYAAEQHVRLTAEQQKTLSLAHEVWELQQMKEKELAQFETLNKELAAIRSKQKKGGAPAILLKQLDDIQEKAGHLQHSRKGEMLMKEIEELQELLSTQERMLKASRRRKLVCGTFALILFSAVGGAAWYAFDTVEERTAALQQAARRGNYAILLDEFQQNAYLQYLYRPVSLEYRRAYADVQKLVQDYHASVDKASQYEQWLESRIAEMTLETLEADVEQIRRHEKNLEALREKYGYEITDSLEEKQHKLARKFDEDLKQQAINSLVDYFSSGESCDFEELVRRYKEFQKRAELLSFKNDEKKSVKQSFDEAVERTLLRRDADIDIMLRQAMRYQSRLEIPDSIIEKLKALKEEKSRFANLPAQLSKCRTLSEYLQTVDACRSSISLIPNACSIEKLDKQRNMLSGMAVRLLLNSGFDGALNYADDELMEVVKRVNDAYSGKGSLFAGKVNEEAMNTIIDKMTLPESSPTWSDYFAQISSAGTIYIGKMLDDKSQRGVREVSLDGHLSEHVVPLSEPCEVRELALSQLRDRMGFNRLELQKGTILPTALMRKLADSNSAGHAPLAKAYLFSLVVDMLHCKNDLESGIMFSSSLRTTLELFKKLKRDLDAKGFTLGANCWLRRRPVEVDELVVNFFHSICNFDYDAEVTDTLKNIVNARVQLAGYFDKDGQVVSISKPDGKELYIIDADRLVRFHGGTGAPYAPMFTISVD